MNQRNQSLDVLRGVAVLSVLFYHSQLFPVMGAGWAGVDLFFVLSGFLISGLLFADIQQLGTIRIGRFLFRRGMKIYPAFYFFLVSTVFFLPGEKSSFWTEAFFLQSYRRLNQPGIAGGTLLGWGHLWSIAVEEHFYLLLPLLLLALNRFRKLSLIPLISAVLIAACFIARIQQGLLHPYGTWIRYPTHLRVDSLFAGVAMGYLFHFERERFTGLSRSWLPLLSGLFLVPVLVARDNPLSTLAISFVLSCNLLAFASLVLWAVPRQIRILSPLGRIGRYSYSIYLWHTLVVYFAFVHQPNSAIYFAAKIVQPNSAIYFAAKIVLAIVLGIAMAHLVELPALAVRERFFRPPRVTPAPSTNPSPYTATQSSVELAR